MFFEPLESRQMFSAVPVLSNFILTVNGDGNSNNISVVLNGPTVTVNNDGAAWAFPAYQVWEVRGNLGAGNDRFDASTMGVAIVVNGESGNDTIAGGTVRDSITGGDGDDVITGGNDNDSLQGNAGNDTIWGEFSGSANVTGNDSLDGGTGNDTLFGDNGNDIIHGSDGDDTLYDYYGLDAVYGDAGNDTVWAEFGSDWLEGGTGYDFIRYDNYSHNSGGVKIDLNGTSSGNGSAGEWDYLTGFEAATGTEFADSITGNTSANQLWGNGGNDTIIGGDGNDMIDGGEGDDALGAQGANFETGADIIYGGGGNDYIGGGYGNDTIYGQAGNDNIWGHEDNDLIYAGTGDDYVNGYSGNDLIWGEDGNDTLDGNDGNDTIGAQNSNFEKGNDVIYGGNGDDYIGGGYGNDTIDGQAGNDNIWGHEDNDSIRGGIGNDYINGFSGNDKIYGGDGNDSLDGSDGNDSIYGENGNDTVVGGNGADYMQGNSGSDTVSYAGRFSAVRVRPDWIANDGAIGEGDNACDFERSIGGSGNDTLYGGAGNDTLEGGAGDDILVTLGNGQSDKVIGGAGLDSFWVDAESSEQITDVSSAEIAATAVHRVASFMPNMVSSAPDTGLSTDTPHPVTRELNGQKIYDPWAPSSAHYASFSSTPLFTSSGPRMDDVGQGAVGDCYLQAALSSIARTNPQKIQQMIVDLGDGSFAVRLDYGSYGQYIRVNSNLPVDANGKTIFGSVSTPMQQSPSLWAALAEKAYFSRWGGYWNPGGGVPQTAFELLGIKWQDISHDNGPGIDSTLTRVRDLLNNGEAVTFGSFDVPAGVPLIGGHYYSVSSVQTNSQGAVTSVTLRNPWGVWGQSQHNPYITVSTAQLASYPRVYFVASNYNA